MITSHKILQEILEENKDLAKVVEKQDEIAIAQIVTTLYKRVYNEIKSIETAMVGQKKEIGSIYTYLSGKKDAKELVRKVLLDHCFFLVTKTRVSERQDANELLEEIEK